MVIHFFAGAASPKSQKQGARPMSTTQQPNVAGRHASEEEAMKVAESAREQSWEKPSFLREVFLGNFRLDLVHPFPEAKGVSRPEFREFYDKMRSFLIDEVDPDA